MAEVVREAFDRDDLFARGARDSRHARPHRLAVEVDGARPAQCHATAELGPRRTERFSQHPEQRGVRGDIDFTVLAVDSEL
jgi:hypothetical protein